VKQLVEFGHDASGEFVHLELGAPSIATLGLRLEEVQKAAPAELEDGSYNGISVPEGARFVWLKFASEKTDLEAEFLDLETIERFSNYTVSEAGWIDYNHFSRPNRMPAEWVAQGVSPQDFIIGKLLEFRFGTDGWAYALGYLWPEGANAHADTMWKRLGLCPESIHCSAGGSPMGRETELRDGVEVGRVRLLTNHIALCDQAMGLGTEAATVPLGEFAKAIANGVPLIPCEGEGCLPCWVRGEEEKSITASGLAASGQVPEDLEGAAKAEGPELPDSLIKEFIRVFVEVAEHIARTHQKSFISTAAREHLIEQGCHPRLAGRIVAQPTEELRHGNAAG